MNQNQPKLQSRQTILLVLILALTAPLSLLAQPTISSFSPTFGPVSTVVTITGANFSTTSANNIVFFGAVKASVIAATSTSLSVRVPVSASYQPIAVTVNGLTGYTAKPFSVTFSDAVLTANAFVYADTLDYVTEIETNDITSGDYDGDGKTDIAVVDRLNNSLSVYKNASIGTTVVFDRAVNFTTGAQPFSIASGDLDGDGRLDIAVTNKDDNTVSVYRNTCVVGSVSFAPKSDVATEAQPLDIALGDFDGDGKTDIAVANAAMFPSSVSVLRNISAVGTISFAIRSNIPVLFAASNIAVADLNGDNKTDIVTASNLSNIMSVLKNTSSTGIITFAPAVDYATGIMPRGLAIGDLDDDGKADISLANFFSNTISIFRNTSTGGTTSFAARRDVSLPGADHISIFDAEGDSKPDVIVQTFSPSGFSVLKNNSSPGTISLETSVAFPAICGYGITAGDWNGDGKTDVGIGCGVFRLGLWINKTTEPQITSYTPASGVAGATVTIMGANFSGAALVTFGGVPASSFAIVNATKITAVVGAGASGEVKVTSLLGTSTMGGFTYAAPPTISSFAPKTASKDTSVTITGTNFTGATAVHFGGVAASSFRVVNATTITAVVGTGASGDVNVTTVFGTATLAGFVFSAPPTITSFSPSFAGSGTTISIFGTNLSGTTSVHFGSVPASSFKVISEKFITAVVDAGGSGDVSVTTVWGTASRPGFTYIPPPDITSFTPASAKYWDTVIITGVNFNYVTSVRFGGVPAYKFTIVNGTTIHAIVGGGASGNIVVTSSYGADSLSSFTFLPPPTVTSFSPLSGPIGTVVTIRGTDFTSATRVYFGAQPAASFTVLSPTTIQAVTGTGNTGFIQVTTLNGFGVSDSDYTFIYPQPTITTFSPTSATTNATVAITGTNFIKVYAVSFGDVAATSFVVNSSTRITATVGAGASGSVKVTTGGGEATKAGFVFLQPPPTITAFYSSFASSGSSISITGTNFLNVSAVTFGGVNASSFVVNSSTSITAIVGAGASGDVTVTTLGGSASKSNFVYDASTITSFSPAFADSGTIVTITGSGFYNVSSVRFGGVPASSIKVNSLTSITAVVGSGGSGDVAVRTMGATGRLAGFTFIALKPAIRSIVPSIAATGATVKLTGYKFSGATAVRFGGTPAASFVVDSDTQITAIIGTGASGDVSITTLNGTATYPGFIYTTAPVITSLSTEAAPVGTPVTISGFNFNATPSGNTVYFGTVKAPVLSASSTRLVVAVPLGASYQPLTVTSNGRTAYASKAFNVTFTSLGTLGADSFTGKLDSAVGNNPNNIAIADIDSDGKNDVAVAAGFIINDDNLALFKNVSTPDVVSFAPRKAVTNNKVPQQTIFADLDGDGNLDMIVGNGVDRYGVSVFRNASTGGFLSFAVEYAINNLRLGDFSVAAGDIDGDGKVDLAVAGVYSKDVSIYKNTSQGNALSFAAPIRQTLGMFPGRISIADIDQDFKPDIVVSASSSLCILRNTSSASAVSFDAATNFLTSGSPYVLTAGLSVSDLDGDGRNDAVIANQYLNTISIFRNISTPGMVDFDTRIELISSINPVDVGVADLDGNNKPDLIIANNDNATLSVFSNTSTVSSVSFAPKFDLTSGAGPCSVAVADIDADGKPDILSANHKAGTFSILRNRIDGYFITSFTPASGTTGAVITIKGTHLNEATSVRFGDAVATSFTVLNDTTITAIIGNGATGSVVVTTPSTTITLPGFTYLLPAPTITAFTPASGTTGSVIDITGTNFTGTTSVYFGDMPAQSFTVNSSTSITAVVASGATGSISITTPAGTATLSKFTYTVVTDITYPNSINPEVLLVNPNPCNSVMVLKHPSSMKDIRLEFIDILGRTVKEVRLKKNTKQTVMNVHGLSQGIYQIIWSDGLKKLSTALYIQGN